LASGNPTGTQKFSSQAFDSILGDFAQLRLFGGETRRERLHNPRYRIQS